MPKFIFPDNFLWGTATSSFQIEGAIKADGRGDSIWDVFCRIPGAIDNGDTGEPACDHYYRFQEDIELLQKMGVKTYRLSIAWPRIFPEGTGKPNKRGIEFYQKLLRLLNDADIKPAVTLYHWDLPQALQNQGGWTNRKTADHFKDYAQVMFEELGGLVAQWITHNEPFVSAHCGYYYGNHAPGLRNPKASFQVAHNILLSHGMAVQKFRELKIPGEIGITLNMTVVHPGSDTPEDKAAAYLKDGFENRWFIDPVFKGSYPEDITQIIRKKGYYPDIHKGDLDLIALPIDFLGLNYYSRSIIRHDSHEPLLNATWCKIPGEKTAMGWEIYPEGLCELLTRIHHDYKPFQIYVTENGAAFNDIVTPDGQVHDSDRLEFLRQHFIQAHKAIENGVPLKGYHVWSFMDNFEWACGYSKRFGIVYVDYQTQQRTFKDSALWYKKVIEENGLD